MKNKVRSLNTYLYLSFLHFLGFAVLNTFFKNFKWSESPGDREVTGHIRGSGSDRQCFSPLSFGVRHELLPFPARPLSLCEGLVARPRERSGRRVGGGCWDDMRKPRSCRTLPQALALCSGERLAPPLACSRHSLHGCKWEGLCDPTPDSVLELAPGLCAEWREGSTQPYSLCPPGSRPGTGEGPSLVLGLSARFPWPPPSCARCGDDTPLVCWEARASCGIVTGLQTDAQRTELRASFVLKAGRTRVERHVSL